MIQPLPYALTLTDGVVVRGQIGIAEMCELEEAHGVSAVAARSTAMLVEMIWRAETNAGRTAAPLALWRRTVRSIDIDPDDAIPVPGADPTQPAL